MMDSLYFLQFACFIFMLINALILGITHLHMIPFNHPQIKKIGTSINFYFYLNTERISPIRIIQSSPPLTVWIASRRFLPSPTARRKANASKTFDLPLALVPIRIPKESIYIVESLKLFQFCNLIFVIIAIVYLNSIL